MNTVNRLVNPNNACHTLNLCYETGYELGDLRDKLREIVI